MSKVLPQLSLAALLALTPQLADAKGGSMQPRVNKDFRELIVKGERPEIAACLVAVIDYARDNRSYDAVRWDDDASDRAIMRETESNGRLTRQVHLVAQMRSHGLFSDNWKRMDVSCVQPEDGSVQVTVTPAA
jgi:hypothetical protein